MTQASAAARQRELVDDLLLIEDVHERLNAIVHRAAKRCLPDALKDDAHRVPGCVSRVWLGASLENGRCRFACDAESPMVKGLVCLLCDVYDGTTPEDAAATEPDLWDTLGLRNNLTPTRQNGLAAVRAAIKAFARQHL